MYAWQINSFCGNENVCCLKYLYGGVPLITFGYFLDLFFSRIKSKLIRGGGRGKIFWINSRINNVFRPVVESDRKVMTPTQNGPENPSKLGQKSRNHDPIVIRARE